ncbi:iron donor protein CyaY [Gilliamella sp. ESL0441]|uniref:iron donor protein CyaY n=1 Tax=Gilliamella sp. ESL0441 TaxID=2704654 RepID=UPI001C6A256A|nr:iron donor protein CyaY [Gilliamella sp. ESL0441]QYN43999.1 iron donor protein CyaY [Gilliamella sp. ESL0441]
MNITQFRTLTEQLFNNIEIYLDDYSEEHDIDIDYETNGNVITISFPNSSKIIVNTQEPLYQVWLATSKQGYHFDYIDDQWICSRTNQNFKTVFSDSVAEQSN